MTSPAASLRIILALTGLLGVLHLALLAARLEGAADPLLLTALLLLGVLAAAVWPVVRARRLERAETRLWLTGGLDRRVFEHAPVGMLLSGSDGRVRAVNPAYTRLTGFSSLELLGSADSFQQAGSLEGSCNEEMLSQLHANGIWEGEVWVRKAGGEALGFKVTRLALQDGEGSVQGWLTTCQESNTSDETQRLMLWQAHHDTLTKLPNANLFQERLSRFLVAQSVAMATDANHRVSLGGGLLSIQLDSFARVNDSMGFASGDQVLMEAAHRIIMAVRESDTVARLGGDQFAVLLAGTDSSDELARVAGVIVETMAEPFLVRGRELFVTASVGILPLAAPDSGAESLSSGEVTQRADSARTQASRAGGNKVVFFEPAMNERAQARYELEISLRQALPQGELELHFQPLVDQFEGRVVSFEALLRWQHPKRGFVSPGEFIQVAEDTGLIVPIGLWIVQQAQQQISHWHDLGYADLRLSINISTRQLRDSSDVEQLLAALDAPQSRWLTLEITESLLVADKDLYRDFLEQARALGARIALDDFGTGYSSLSYLRDYRFDVLKIDRSFVTQLPREPAADPEAGDHDRNLMASIISLGEILQLQVVAEGVETQAELAVLAELGCGVIQGYYYAAPMPAQAADRYLLNVAQLGELRKPAQDAQDAEQTGSLANVRTWASGA